MSTFHGEKIMEEIKKHGITINDHQVVSFNNIKNTRIKIKPMYFDLGFSSSSAIFGRVAVYRRLLIVLSILPENYGIVVWDVYRPREVQGRLFEWMSNEIKKNKPFLSDVENYNETLKYMSAPSKRGDKYCTPHLSGGAIDLTFFDVGSGLELDMGTIFDDCTEVAGRDFFSKKEGLSESEIIIKHRRNLLRNSMEHVGFTSYVHEWWHFDIGDIFWGRELELEPVFGPLFGNEEWPNIIADFAK